MASFFAGGAAVRLSVSVFVCPCFGFGFGSGFGSGSGSGFAPGCDSGSGSRSRLGVGAEPRRWTDILSVHRRSIGRSISVFKHYIRSVVKKMDFAMDATNIKKCCSLL